MNPEGASGAVNPHGASGAVNPHGASGAVNPHDAVGWGDETGVLSLPAGARVRGRRLTDEASPSDFTLVLADGPVPRWRYRRVRWPDFWVPADTRDALDALRLAHRLAYQGARVEAACHGGKGRTGTALAALAVLDGLAPREAVTWVRERYRPEAVEMPWQRWWLHLVARAR